MDIAKYIATAVILSSVFGEVEPKVVYWLRGAAVVVAMIIGLWLVSDKPIIIRRNRNVN